MGSSSLRPTHGWPGSTRLATRPAVLKHINSMRQPNGLIKILGQCSFRTFVRFVLVWIWFPLPLGVWEGLRFVIVALPGLFSYLFFHMVFVKHGNIGDSFLTYLTC